MSRLIQLPVLALLSLLVMRSSVLAAAPIALSGQAFGTSYSIKLCAADNSVDQAGVSSRLAELFETIDRQMSLWRDESELTLFNRNQSLDWFPVSVETVDVVLAAIEVTRITDGAFDPTVGPLVQLWSFGPQQQPLRVPSDEQIAEARRHVGIDLIEARRSPPAIRKLDPAVQLDLNAIAKGDAVDRAAQLLDEFEPTGYMVEIGGEVRTFGTRKDGSPWAIGIERPVVAERVLQSIVDLNTAAMATSGDYRNFVVADGQRYSHTIDPRTGRPIEHALAAASVVADNCMLADAWATAIMVLGPDEGLRIAEANGIAALLIRHAGDGFVEERTSTFPAIRVPEHQAHESNTLSTMLLAALVFGLAVAGMAIGVIISNRRLHGSCGGLEGLKDSRGNPLCEACTHPVAECEQFRAQVASTAPPQST